MNNKTFYVYELRDEAGLVFYVGKGCGARHRSHVAKARAGEAGKKAAKIRSILTRGGHVDAAIVFETIDEREAFSEEIRLIAFYGRATLTNLTDGGDGPSNPTLEVRLKMAAARRGRIASPETRAKQRALKVGTTRTPEVRAKLSAAQRGSSHPWARALAFKNLSRISWIGRVHTPETIAKIRAAKMGHAVSEETRRKISESKKGRSPAWNKGKEGPPPWNKGIRWKKGKKS